MEFAIFLTFEEVEYAGAMNNIQSSSLTISLKGGEDEPAQGQTILSSNLNQEEMLKPPILCEGIAAAGLQGIHTQRLHQSHCFHSAPQQPKASATLSNKVALRHMT